jgi:hypothetical protein
MTETELLMAVPKIFKQFYAIGGRYPDQPNRIESFLKRVQNQPAVAIVLPTTITNPPTQVEVQQLRDAIQTLSNTLNNLIAATKET